jgi:hypothetical protein
VTPVIKVVRRHGTCSKVPVVKSIRSYTEDEKGVHSPPLGSRTTCFLGLAQIVTVPATITNTMPWKYEHERIPHLKLYVVESCGQIVGYAPAAASSEM